MAATKTTAKKTVKAADPTMKAAVVNEDAIKSAEDFTAAAQDQFQKMVDLFAGNAEEMREKVETLTSEMRARMEKTQQHVADVNADLAEAARTEVSDAVQFANDLAKAKTFADALTVQQSYWTNLFDTRIKRIKDMTQTSIDVTREALEPAGDTFGAFFDQSKLFEGFFPAKA